MTEEQKAFTQRWTSLLRSGEVEQARETLMKIDRDGTPSFCCLGVFAALAALEGRNEYLIDSHGCSLTCTGVLADGGDYLSSAYPNWVDFERLTGIDRQDGDDLARLNDSGRSFSDIADAIEEKVRKVALG